MRESSRRETSQTEEGAAVGEVETNCPSGAGVFSCTGVQFVWMMSYMRTSI